MEQINADHEKTHPNNHGGNSASLKTNKKFKAVKKNKGFIRRLLHWFIGFFIFLLVLIVAFGIVLKVGIGGEFLTSQIQAALTRQLDKIATATLSETRLSLDQYFHVVFEADNVTLENIKGGISVDNIGQIKIGLSTLALLKGKLEIQKIELHNSNITLPKTNGGNILDKLPQDAFGRVDPDIIANTLFPSFDNADILLKSLSVNVIILNNISIKMAKEGSPPLYIDSLKLTMGKEDINLSSNLILQEQKIGLEGKIGYKDNLANTIELKLSRLPLHLGAPDNISPFLANGRINNGHFRLKGDTDILVTAYRENKDAAPQIQMEILMPKGLLDLGIVQDIPTEFAIYLEHLPQSRKIEVKPSKLITGGVALNFNGALGLVPPINNNEKPEYDYRFELLSNKAVIAASGIPEQALNMSTKIAGQFRLSDKKAYIDELVVNTPNGNIIGQGSLRFGVGTPETIFVLHSANIDIAEAKQLWPVNIAAGARTWIATHVFGGSLQNSMLEIALPIGFFRSGIPSEPLTEKEIKVKADIVKTRSDLIGDLPALRDISGSLTVAGTTTNILFDKAVGYLPNEKQITISDGSVLIPYSLQRPVYADMHFVATGDIASAGDIIGYAPINAKSKLPFNSDQAKGTVVTTIDLRFPVTKDEPRGEITYNAKVDFSDVSLLETNNNINVKDATGTAEISKEFVKVNAKGLMNDLPSTVEVVQAFNSSLVKNSEKITLILDDATREKYFSFLNIFLKGPITVDIGEKIAGRRHIIADLTAATLEIPWVGWKKNKSITAKAEFDVPADLLNSVEYKIDNFSLTSANLDISGSLNIKNKQLQSAKFSKLQINRNDKLTLNITNNGQAYNITINGQRFDARGLIQQMSGAFGGSKNAMAVNINANITEVIGFYNEILHQVDVKYTSAAGNNSQIYLKATTSQNIPIVMQMQNVKGMQSLVANSADAGRLLRFINYYDKMEGGVLNLEMQASPNKPLSGPVSIRDFVLVDEDKLDKLVSSKPQGSKSLNDAVKGKINSKRVKFDLAFAQIAKGDNFLVLDLGVVRGPIVGATFQGVLYDSSGNVSLTGTFMPAYGLNRIFGDLPVIGQILGNGRDGGLLGITFKVTGSAKQPQVIVNPISAIAPGIFRSIFEFQ